MPELLSISGLSYALPGGQTVLREISFKVEPGQMLWVSGPSGGGKTTLLRLINRLIRPSRGILSLEGRDYSDWPVPQLRRRLALLPQSPLLMPGSIRHNLLLPFSFKVAGSKVEPGDHELRDLLKRLGLDDLEPDRNTDGLSVGQVQRISLGRLLLMAPKALLLDEPLAALDETSRHLALKELSRFSAQSGAVIMVSHIAPPDGDFLQYRLEHGSLSAPHGGENA